MNAHVLEVRRCQVLHDLYVTCMSSRGRRSPAGRDVFIPADLFDQLETIVLAEPQEIARESLASLASPQWATGPVTIGGERVSA